MVHSSLMVTTTLIGLHGNGDPIGNVEGMPKSSKGLGQVPVVKALWAKPESIGQNRLPYFDPSRFVVVDAMHNLFLGLIHEHFTGILGLHLPTDKDKDPPVLQLRISDAWKQLSKNEGSSMKRVMSWLEKPMVASLCTDDGKMHWLKKLLNEHLSILKLLCIELDLQPKPADSRKVHNFHWADYARSILEWVSGNNFGPGDFLEHSQRSAQTEQDVDPLGHSSTQTKCGFVLTKADVQAIREDILHMTRPSWFTSVPNQLGHAAHGKLKADQWRVLGTTFLPISLNRLWSDLDVNDPRSVRCRKIVNLTLDLVSAVITATSRTTSSAHVCAYRQHMQDYLVGLKNIFPDYKFHANHHMALHLAEYIALFGPVHSWWAFPFKRIIGMLQHISTNYKPGECCSM